MPCFLPSFHMGLDLIRTLRSHVCSARVPFSFPLLRSARLQVACPLLTQYLLCRELGGRYPIELSGVFSYYFVSFRPVKLSVLFLYFPLPTLPYPSFPFSKAATTYYLTLHVPIPSLAIFLQGVAAVSGLRPCPPTFSL
ncbi:hypothetical protein BT96DRAFT_564107 [Gymnopus androsaceus JB14]|uniref:Uncharacterized protein n=1 Tax=Gymnopus androsaceus JB14 TaxID=1447944 RepID=A0A6A4HWD2_9AGAR|nr:hypothetical protein BT96DRAFT_564107 [Gymnopus androsaceus JB14]